MNKQLFRDTTMRKFESVSPPEGKWPKGVLDVLEGPCMEVDVVNENNRLYSKRIISERILGDPDVQKDLANRAMIMEGCHPEDRFNTVYPNTAGLVEKLWVPDDDQNHLWGRFLILDTPNGRIIKTLHDVGSKIGVSARAAGLSTPNRDGVEVMDEENYIFYTFDFVPDPGFAIARPTAVNESRNAISDGIPSMSESELLQTKTLLEGLNKEFFAKELQQVNEALSKVSRPRAMLEESQRRIAELEKALESSAKREEAQAKSPLYRIPSSVVAEVKRLQGELDEAQKDKEELQRSVDRARQETEQSRRENDELRGKMDDLRKQVYQLQGQLKDAKKSGTAFEAKDRQLSASREAEQKLRGELDKSESENRALRCKLYDSQIRELSASTGMSEARVRELVPEVKQPMLELRDKLKALAEKETPVLRGVQVVSESADADSRLVGLVKSQMGK